MTKFETLKEIIADDEGEEFANSPGEWPESWSKFTDEISDWAYAFADVDFTDNVCFYFAPNSDTLSDEYFTFIFAEKMLQPHFEDEISELMESCFEIENISESDFENVMTKLGVTKRSRNWS